MSGRPGRFILRKRVVDSKPFQFKQFSVRHDRCAMKIGTDGVLLGAWAFQDVPALHQKPCSILDIGTGCGLIALQMAQRFDSAGITGVEIDSEAAGQARENVLASPWKSRVKIQAVALQDFVPQGRFDAIISNPPFFFEEVSSKNPLRDQARQHASLPLPVLMSFAAKNLAVGGRLALVSPFGSESLIKSEGIKNKLNLVRVCRVKGHKDADFKRVLMEFVLGEQGSTKQEELILEVSRGEYTEAYRRLTAPFYLKM